MSLINQVLNDLEKRGASSHIGEASSIRVVPLRRSHATFWWLFSGLSAAVLLAGAWHNWGSDVLLMLDDAPSAQIIAVPAVTLGSVSAPAVSAVQAASAVQDSAVTVAAASAIPAAVEAVAASAKPAIAEKPLAIAGPLISSVDPGTLAISAAVQTLSIAGSNFAPDAMLILRTPKRNTFSRRKIVQQNAQQITLALKLPNSPGVWSVEVVNPSGHSSGQFAFTVLPQALADKTVPEAATGSARQVAVVTAKEEPLAPGKNGISKRLTQITPQQQAENEYRNAYRLLQQGQTAAAISGFEAVLQLDAGHTAARQALVKLLLESKRSADAERVVREGLQHDPAQSNLALLLARMQVGRNELPEALQTMEKSLPYAAKQADYQAFLAALLQRQNRHAEAIGYFQNALKLNPQSGVWLMGLGISLRAEQRNSEAREAYNRALEVHNLSDELQAFVAQQLKEL